MLTSSRLLLLQWSRLPYLSFFLATPCSCHKSDSSELTCSNKHFLGQSCTAQIFTKEAIQLPYRNGAPNSQPDRHFRANRPDSDILLLFKMLDVPSYLGDVILCIVLYLCVATIAKVPSVQDPWLLLIQCICAALLTQLVFGIVKERRALRVERDGGWASIKLAQQQVESVLKVNVSRRNTPKTKS